MADSKVQNKSGTFGEKNQLKPKGVFSYHAMMSKFINTENDYFNYFQIRVRELQNEWHARAAGNGE